MSLSTGFRLGPYEILSPLGAGGMGEVWRARDTRLDREVAIKVLPEEFFEDKERTERFRREAKLLAAVNHPNIAVVHSFEEISGQHLLVQELVEGETLSARLAGGALSTEEVFRIGHQLADALAHAHERGVGHRDFKSGNVILTPEGRAKVLDFGLAKRLSAKEADEATTLSRASLTEAGTVAGTPAYMAPEQLRGLPADARSDVWALGVVLYEMATGKRPFQGKTGFELSSAIFSQQPKPLPAAVPAALQTLIERCLAKEPSRRYQRGSEVRAALEAIQSGREPSPWPALVYSIRRRPRLVLFASLAMALALGADWWWKVKAGAGSGGKRLAVLPFENLSGDPEQEYLSDGLTQEMIAQLGRLHPASLAVIARTSVMQYKKTQKPIDQIGRELGVDYVLEGSARREGGRVRIAAELIEVRRQAQLWADSFERDLSGILDLQNDVSQKVAAALALRLLPAEQARIAKARPVNPEAYEAYLKGSYHWARATAEDLSIAEQYFDKANEKDPSYAPAFAGRAWVWLVRNQLGLASHEAAGPKAAAAARRAVELDENSATGYQALAQVRTVIEWDWDGARESWRRAIQLDPNEATAQALYGHFLAFMGNGEEALIHGARAAVLDPFNPVIIGWHANLLLFERRYDEAIAAARKGQRLQQDNPTLTAALWYAFHEKGMKKEAFEAARVCARITYNDPAIEAALDEGYARGGYAEAMRRGAEFLIARIPVTYSLPFDIAAFYALAGENSKALDWLEKGLDIHDPSLPYVGLPNFDGLRSDPRYAALLRKMNLPVT